MHWPLFKIEIFPALKITFTHIVLMNVPHQTAVNGDIMFM